MLKNSFITGLMTVLPLAFTYIILKFILDFITTPFIGLYSLYVEPKIDAIIPSYLIKSKTLLIFKQALILFIVIQVILAIGLIVRHMFSPSLSEFFSYITNRVPLLNTIYTTTKQVIHALLREESKSFKQVVIVPFNGGHAFGLLTGIPDSPSITPEMISVFIPTAPSPISGFLICYHKHDVRTVNMSVHDLFQYIISLGLISPKHSKEELKNK